MSALKFAALVSAVVCLALYAVAWFGERPVLGRVGTVFALLTIFLNLYRFRNIRQTNG